MSSQELKVMNHHKELIKIISETDTFIEADLTELHMKEDGTIYDTPSLAFVSVTPNYTIVSQVSLRMLTDALKELGYKIIKNPKTK